MLSPPAGVRKPPGAKNTSRPPHLGRQPRQLQRVHLVAELLHVAVVALQAAGPQRAGVRASFFLCRGSKDGCAVEPHANSEARATGA